MHSIECLAQKVLSFISIDHTSSQPPLFVEDDTSNYSSNLLSMELLAWNFEDAIKEGDGDRIIRM